MTVCATYEFESQPPTLTSNRVCQTLTTCSQDEYESTPPSYNSDRVCHTKICTCSNGNLGTCTTHGEEICESCNRGYRFNGNTCTLCQSGFQPFDNHKGDCQDWTTCFTLPSQPEYQVTSASPYHDRTCARKQCVCHGGKTTSGSACPIHNSIYCTECNAFYSMKDHKCTLHYSDIIYRFTPLAIACIALGLILFH